MAAQRGAIIGFMAHTTLHIQAAFPVSRRSRRSGTTGSSRIAFASADSFARNSSGMRTSTSRAKVVKEKPIIALLEPEAIKGHMCRSDVR